MSLSGLLSAEFAREFADDWINAWNARDIDRVMMHYAEDFEMRSPRIFAVMGEDSGILKGKAKVRAYWEKALAANPDLHFQFISVYAGVMSLVLLHSQRRQEVAEYLIFGAEGLVVQSGALWRIER